MRVECITINKEIYRPIEALPQVGSSTQQDERGLVNGEFRQAKEFVVISVGGDIPKSQPEQH